MPSSEKLAGVRQFSANGGCYQGAGSRRWAWLPGDRYNGAHQCGRSDVVRTSLMLRNIGGIRVFSKRSGNRTRSLPTDAKVQTGDAVS